MPASNIKHVVVPSVVLVGGALDCGGAQRSMADMANYWADKGWQVTLATWSGPELPDFYSLSAAVSRIWLDVGSPDSSLIGKARAFARRIFRLRKLLRQAKPDAVVSFIDVSNIHTIVAALGLRVRVVISERTHPGVNFTVSSAWRVLRRLLYSRADQVVAQTQEAARWIEQVCRTAVLVIPNALRRLPAPQPQREPLIIAVGRLSREKGFDLLLEAFARICAHFPDWRLCIIGQGAEGPALKELAISLKLQGRVDFVGQVSDVETWMARAAVLVHPSRREGFPNVVLEAMAMGLAVICTDCRSGPAELIQDGINGRLVPVDDLEILVRAMSEVLVSPDLRKRLGAEAAKVRQRYEQSVVMKKWEACVLAQASCKSHESNSDIHSG
jgi:GalNAc-alpha-(1->4)-GalNAc-alpha-(1->3)-diNAcBac-PP-undecaprenol alpha-1,4-N-acetyl-D-galactosaminyltransferase